MKVFTTKQEASNFFETLSEADYIFFANECSKFDYHSYNAENIEKSLKSELSNLLAENERLSSEKKSLEENIKTLEQSHKAEKECLKQKLQQEQQAELTKIREEEMRRCETKYKNDIDNMKNKNGILKEQFNVECEIKCKYNEILTEPFKKFKNDTKHLVKKPEKSKEIGTDDALTVENILKQHPLLKTERKAGSSTVEIHVDFKSSTVKAMVVVKPYQKQPISEEEVKKFINNLDNNSDVECGIFIAMKNRFAEVYQEYNVYKTTNRKPYFMISNLLDRTYREIPLLFALSALEIIVETRSIEEHGTIQPVDKCIKDWAVMQTSADSMIRDAKIFIDEANKIIEKIKNAMADTNERLAKLRKKATELVEESSTTTIESTEIQSPTKKLRTDE